MLVQDGFYNILQNEQIWSKEFQEISILVCQNRQISRKLRKKNFLGLKPMQKVSSTSLL